MMRTGWLSLMAALLVSTVHAQAPDPGAAERVRLITDESRRRAEVRTDFLNLARQQEKQHTVGGWVTFTGLDLRNDDHNVRAADNVRSVRIEDYRIFAAGELFDRTKYYVRARKFDFEFDARAGIAPPDLSQQESPEVDQAWLDVGLGNGATLRAGRQFVYVGRALVLSADLDGAQVTVADGPWTHRAFGGSTVDRDPNIDNSIAGFNRRGLTDRDFYFGESSYSFQSGHRAYGYVTVQQDNSRSLSAAQNRRDFAYNSVYYGLGAAGPIDQLLHYYVELIHEDGTMLADAPNRRVGIDADALVAGLLFYPDFRWHPLLTLELGYGTGDRARSSVTNTFGGKLSATSDNNFLYFGVYDAGLALSPRLSNLAVLRLGYQVKPFPREGRQLPGLLVGSKVNGYWKDERNGVISDPLAIRASHYVGWGFDVFAGFRPLSDLSMLAQYGRFTPGGAYGTGAQDSTTRVLLTSTLSF